MMGFNKHVKLPDRRQIGFKIWPTESSSMDLVIISMKGAAVMKRKLPSQPDKQNSSESKETKDEKTPRKSMKELLESHGFIESSETGQVYVIGGQRKPTKKKPT
jgi:hypothetical protein